MTVRAGPDAGRVSPFLAIAFTGVFAVIGLTHDAAGQIRTLHAAQLVAAEAARAAGQAVDRDRALSGGSHRLEPYAAEQAARDYLDRAGPAVELTAIAFSPDLTSVTVTVTGAYRPVFLSLFGASGRAVTGRATVTLRSG